MQPRPSSVRCVACGYDLTGATIGGACPECGSLIERSIAKRGITTNGHAIASMVLGIFSVTLFCGPGIVCGLLGLITGIVALRQIKAERYDTASTRMAIAGLILSSLGIVIFIAFILFYIV